MVRGGSYSDQAEEQKCRRVQDRRRDLQKGAAESIGSTANVIICFPGLKIDY